MRILQVVLFYPPAWGYGGPPRVMFALGKALAAAGHDVTVYTSDVLDDDRRVSERERVLDGVRIVAFRNLFNRLAWERKLILPMGLVSELRRTVRQFDVVHVSSVRSLMHAGVQFVLRGAGVPYVVDAHGSLPKPVNWKRSVAAVYDRVVLRPFLVQASALLAQTEHEAALYRQYAPRGRIERLPLALELTEFERPVERGRLRSRLGVGEDAFVALFLGRIEGRKGVEFLVEAFAEFRRRSSRPSYLALVGRDSGSLPRVLETISRLGLEAEVKFLGPMYGDDRLAAYRDADVFVHTPPYWEETSVAALEACACGTPCVITRQAEIPGLDESGGGVTIAYGDSEALVQVLERLASDEALRSRMGRCAAELVRRSFAVEQVGPRLEQILRHAVNGKRAKA